jgi:heme/copper-type cytochrome/quinol oxidase subunit 1
MSGIGDAIAVPASNAGEISLDALRGAAEVTSLSDVEKTSPITFGEEIARSNQRLKERVARYIMWFMGGSLMVTLLLTLALAGIDARFIAFDLIEPTERLITENVIMAVIAATVAQVGAASIAIVYSLFGRPKGDEGD